MGALSELPDDRFAPVRSFLRDLDGLVGSGGSDSGSVLSVKTRLSRLIEREPDLPDDIMVATGDQYARHLLYEDPRERFEVIVMAWAPGQSTPVHDHSGIWCVEGVLRGVIDVTRYELTGPMSLNTARLVPTELIHAGHGQCGALIPPVEYHRIANPHQEPAVSIHVYGGRMRTCRVFHPRSDGVYDVEVKPLAYTSRRHAMAAS